jgi:Predicted methyltransferases
VSCAIFAQNFYMTSKKGVLYLIPTPLAEGPVENSLPEVVLAQIPKLRYFVVEELRTARRFLSQAGLKGQIDGLWLRELNEHTAPEALQELLQPLLDGEDLGLLSEAGLPAVADPGAGLVALAQQRGIQVVPLVGPSSLMLALMASGMNGQNFAFVGYLPVSSQERRARLKQLERRAATEAQTQLFIETPYRNLSLFQDILESCGSATRLCIAANLTAPEGFVQTKTVAQWHKEPAPPIHKVPTVFVLEARCV